jgi:hypothetical protein
VRPGRKARQIPSGETKHLLAFGQVLLERQPNRRNLFILLPSYCFLLVKWDTDNDTDTLRIVSLIMRPLK